jgi:hypothetical protein
MDGLWILQCGIKGTWSKVIVLAGVGNMPEMETNLPDVVTCTKCNRLVEVEMSQSVPDRDTPKEKITQIFEPRYPYFSVQCSACGQYSIFTPFTMDGSS